MIKILPFILVALLILGGLGYFRFFAAKQSLEAPTTQVSEEPVEVPKTLPGASLEDTITNVVNKLNASPKPQIDSGLDSRLKTVEAGITELKARVSSLEKGTTTTTQTSSSKVPLYIPLGSGGSTASQAYVSMSTYQVTLNPADYTGYSSMQLEVNIRKNQPGEKVYARLYNTTDNTAVSSEVSTESTTFVWLSSSTFTLPSGQKTYTLQVKVPDGTEAFIQNARIKVNF